jgi:hypothetical protein
MEKGTSSYEKFPQLPAARLGKSWKISTRPITKDFNKF